MKLNDILDKLKLKPYGMPLMLEANKVDVKGLIGLINKHCMEIKEVVDRIEGGK